MNSSAHDPGRFKPFREPLIATIRRNGLIAVVVSLVIVTVRHKHFPTSAAEWYAWFALAVFVAWITFGGHLLELIYLNGLRPRLAHWHDASLIFLRLTIWGIGGTLICLAAIYSLSLLMTGSFPNPPVIAKSLSLGGLAFVAIELFIHAFLLLSNKASFWNLRG